MKSARTLLIISLLAVIFAGCRSKTASLTFTETVYEPQEAQGFKIMGDSLGNTLLEVYNPWQGADGAVSRAIILADGSEAPDDFDGAVLRGPARRVVAMSSTYVAMLSELGHADDIVGVSGIDFICDENVQARRNEIIDVGNEADVDFERLLACEPDIVLIYGVNSVSAMEAKLRELEIPFIYIPDYLETSPLGKAEWIVAVGHLVGDRQKAEKIYTDISQRYNSLKNSAADIVTAPKVMINIPYNDVWYMPSTDSYMAQLIADAGGKYVYDATTGNSSATVSLEEAYRLAADADVWLNPGQTSSMAQLLAAVPHFTDVSPIAQGKVFNNNAITTPGGGNDFYESGAIHPDRVLSDLIKIFSEDSPSGLYYYRQLR